MKHTSIHWTKLFAGTGLALAFTTLVASAFADGPPPIPAEAYAACESKSAGEACSLQFRDLKIEGTCAQAPSGDRLACRPNHMPSPPPGGGR